MEFCEFRGIRVTVHVQFPNLVERAQVSPRKQKEKEKGTCSGVGRRGFSSLRKTWVQVSGSNCCIFRAISSGSSFRKSCIKISNIDY